ncbi:hypothetical protein [Nocardioides coralli]|uniref:hypothetical protein n=1 Tax=Nocardioides coralli TaxID=2872154 RepID=UPI001CA441D9|nr:hypothetical protein [Nocardioides coralli]QZY29605.1 hypothetical protein K6T13_02620 [Nocardioides coralli]
MLAPVDLPSFVPVATRRPVTVARPAPLTEALAPYVAVTGPATPGAELVLRSGDDRLVGHHDGTGFALAVTAGGRTTHHRSRRSGRARREVDRLALALTGTHLAVLGREGDDWVVRGRVDLRERVDTRDEGWLAGLAAEGGELHGFGELGLRDLRLVTRADGSAWWEDDRVLLTATSAGPGFFDTAHTSVWSLDPVSLELEHRSDLFLRRTDRPGVYGDHACHLLRDGDRWLLAASTWGDFDPAVRGATVRATLGTSTEDLLTGRHVLDTVPLDLPTTGFRSVGIWDPALVRTADGWLAAYVSASRFFRFHPVVATGPSLDALTLRAAATRGHTETEGVTWHRHHGVWRLLVSDKPGRRYPVLDLDLREVGVLDAPYTDNLPWPTVVEHAGGWLHIGFDGTPHGGRLVGYGSHGTVHLARSHP